MLRSYPLRHLRYFFYVYLISILTFFLFRMLLFLTNSGEMESIPGGLRLFSTSFLIGLQFDTVITCYLLFLPLLLITLMKVVTPGKTWMYPVIFYYLVVIYFPVLFLTAADIPYYHHYSSRISVAILNWTNSPGFVFRMIVEEPRFFIYFFVFLFFYAGFIVALKRIHRNLKKSYSQQVQISGWKYWLLLLAGTILLSGLLFIGARGRLSKKSPIKPGAAYFSQYNFPNQLALNPVYSFMVSTLDNMDESRRSIHLMDEKTAIRNAQHLLAVPSSAMASPIARWVIPDKPLLRANVVIVIMESMSGEWMSYFNNPETLTPNLDTLAHHCAFFGNTYSSGIHTFNGVYSVLFGYPSLLHQHTMNMTIIPNYSGIGRTLLDKGYHTIYFTTHDELFDNISGFLKANGIERIISQKDYPSEKVLSTLGVPDDYMLSYSIPVLNELHNTKKPFLAVMMTASLHEPYIIPEESGFRSGAAKPDSRLAAYSDWSIGKFLKEASRQAWFDSTIFVFIGDHGANPQTGYYDMQLRLQHTPLFIYSPLLVQPGIHEEIGGQIDVFPTVMGILGLRYLNNTMGVDLFKEKRPCIYFTADDKIGCLGDEYFFIHRMVDGMEFLHHYRDHDLGNHLDQHPGVADSLRNYAYSMLQTTQWMLTNKKTFIGLH